MSNVLNFLRLTPDSTLPLYQQIQDNLLQLIDSNLLNTGDPLPSERQLSEVYGVNRMTVRQALDGLVRKGVVDRRQGTGSFVASFKPFTPTVVGFSQRMHEAGMNPSSRLLHREVITPEPLIAHRLHLKPDDRVIMLKRLRLLNDEPLMIETSYLSYGMFPGLMQADVENESLYRVLKNDYGLVVQEAEHTMEPTLPNAYEAYNLGVPMNAPAMLVRVVAYSADNIPIEMSKAVVRGDRCRYFFRVNTRIPIMD
ncbi:MAG: GntR family transcriptional regulator [Pleurocapsa minor GSE-CHR-MK-17-07R]|jgi:GntR family transcriptional regulator|nr:GntR family transcriptional regulator [Pleurocapsa minor GSE-CHR-MK 17-07R]